MMDFDFDLSPMKENVSPLRTSPRKSIASIGSGISPQRDVSISSMSSNVSKSPMNPLRDSMFMYASASKSKNSSHGQRSESVSKTPAYASRSDSMSKTPAYSTSSASVELLQKRIEHLERERVDLSLQLHTRDEKERSKLKTLEQAKEDLTANVAASKKENDALRTQREILETEVKRLTALSNNAVQAEGLWNKMTAATRELRRVEEEAAGFRGEAEAAKKEKTEAVLRMEILEQQVKSLHDDLVAAKRTQQDLHDLSDKFKEKCSVNATLEESMDMLRSSIVEKDDEARSQREAFLAEETRLLNDNTLMRLKLKELSEELQRERSLRSDMVKSVDSDAEGDEEELAMINCAAVQALKEQLQESEARRRKLHNALQELKGNVRVYVRCRPFLSADGSDALANAESPCVQCNRDGMSVALVGTTRGAGQIFSYDHVFQPDVSQHKVYDEVSDFIQSSLDGYRVCIFSYGQTGSGKTHTMTGAKSNNQRGIIPRAVEHIVTEASAMREKGWDITVTTSMVELYNEELKDLLTSSPSSASQKEGGATVPKLKITYQNGCVHVPGLVSMPLTTTDAHEAMEQLQAILDQSTRNRTTACTAMNEHSSRSHALFMLDISGKHSDGTSFMKGGLRLCDLAGSERLDRTGTLNDAMRLKETVNINKSLSCLADVFSALSAKQSHVPYRNSKLTMLLQDCLSGDGKSLMIVNLSPTLASSQETLCSLRFASQVSKVELGKAQKNMMTMMPTMANNMGAPTQSMPSYMHGTHAVKSANSTSASDADSETSGRPLTAQSSSGHIGTAAGRRMSVMPGHFAASDSKRMSVMPRESAYRQSIASKRMSTMPGMHSHSVRESATELSAQQTKRQKAQNLWR